MTLEKEIYSIETANINKETLDAMQSASKAMKQIHNGLDIGKVDDVMYVFPPYPYVSSLRLLIETVSAGNLSANNTPSAKKLAKPLLRASQPAASTKTSLTRNSRNYSRRRWTRICSRLAAYP
jgi:hypothetical protein